LGGMVLCFGVAVQSLYRFDLLLKLGAREHNAPPAGRAANADVRPDSRHVPRLSPAGMELSQTNAVADAEIQRPVLSRHRFTFR